MAGSTQARQQELESELSCSEAWVGQSRSESSFSVDATAALFRTVETEIIPRLMLLHQQDAKAAAQGPVGKAGLALGIDQVKTLTALVLEGREGAENYLRELQQQGAELEALCLQLLAPTARHLGELWEADLCEFTDVTIALARLQGLLRFLLIDSSLPRRKASIGRTALFAPVPGEQHTFGLTMVCDFFRSSGWDVWSETPSGADGLVALVRDRRFDLVGFAIGSDRGIPALAELIRAIRTTSKNRAVRVLAGGPLLIARPQIAALVGADGTAADARQAMLEAERLLAGRGGGR